MINRLARARVALKAKPFSRHYPSKTSAAVQHHNPER
jgi:hypothetical protein